MASVKVVPNAVPLFIEPTEIYGTEGPILLRIATGGAGQSGLLRSLAEGFINDANDNGLVSFSRRYSSVPESQRPSGCVVPFRACWLVSDTSASFNYLAQNAADVSITYHAIAEKIAIDQGAADRREYAWRDHWMLVGKSLFFARKQKMSYQHMTISFALQVSSLKGTMFSSDGVEGPKSNPARLPIENQKTIYELFAQIFCSAIETATEAEPVRYLSRYDKSASNICESKIWTTIGQIPWAYPYSTWYHRFPAFPFEALKVASKLGEYTLVDRGTWYSIEDDVRDKLDVFASASDNKDDPLVNPAHALIGAFGANKVMATEFVDWMIKPDGGQNVVTKFAVNGHVLYSPAPKDDDDRVPNMLR